MNARLGTVCFLVGVIGCDGEHVSKAGGTGGAHHHGSGDTLSDGGSGGGSDTTPSAGGLGGERVTSERGGGGSEDPELGSVCGAEPPVAWDPVASCAELEPFELSLEGEITLQPNIYKESVHLEKRVDVTFSDSGVCRAFVNFEFEPAGVYRVRKSESFLMLEADEPATLGIAGEEYEEFSVNQLVLNLEPHMAGQCARAIVHAYTSDWVQDEEPSGTGVVPAAIGELGAVEFVFAKLGMGSHYWGPWPRRPSAAPWDPWVVAASRPVDALADSLSVTDDEGTPLGVSITPGLLDWPHLAPSYATVVFDDWVTAMGKSFQIESEPLMDLGGNESVAAALSGSLPDVPAARTAFEFDTSQDSGVWADMASFENGMLKLEQDNDGRRGVAALVVDTSAATSLKFRLSSEDSYALPVFLAGGAELDCTEVGNAQNGDIYLYDYVCPIDPQSEVPLVIVGETFVDYVRAEP
jgi:hypothetical protein